VNRCINGNCALPGETSVVDEGCYASLSVFSVDYDAPLGKDQTDLRVTMEPLVAFKDPVSKMAVKARGILTSMCFPSCFKTRRADISSLTQRKNSRTVILFGTSKFQGVMLRSLIFHVRYKYKYKCS
jgi:hypothetical protein